MDTMTIRRFYDLLDKAGYQFPTTCPEGMLCIIDPACVWPPLLEFINTAWIIITIIAGFLLAGWGITMVRGAKHDMMKNLVTLVLIFGTLSAALPIIKMLGGEKALVNQCDTVQIPFDQIQNQIGKDFEKSNYETFEIRDSGVYNMEDFQGVLPNEDIDF